MQMNGILVGKMVVKKDMLASILIFFVTGTSIA